MKVILVRHGQIDSNIAKVYSGRSTESLNEIGRQQARDAVEKMRDIDIAALISSPLPRATETAGIIADAIGLAATVSDAFNELRMGPWEGLSEYEVAERFPDEFAIWNSTPADLRLPGRETLDELQARAVEGLNTACAATHGNSLVIVSHVAVIRAIQLFVSGRPLNDYKKILVPNATPIAIEWDLAPERVVP